MINQNIIYTSFRPKVTNVSVAIRLLKGRRDVDK